MVHLTYFTLSLAVLAVLCLILRRTYAGPMTRPRNVEETQTGAIVVVTVFAVSCAGAIALFGTILNWGDGGQYLALALGLALVTKGVGFQYAARAMRRTLSDVAPASPSTPRDRRRDLKLTNL